MNISIIIPVKNQVKEISNCSNSIIKQLHPKDDIFIVDMGSNDGLSSDLFSKKIKYYRTNERETLVLNDIIINDIKNDCILIIEPFYILPDGFLEYIRENHRPKEIKTFKVEKIIKPSKVKNENHTFIDRYSMSFDRKEGMKVGLFNEYFDYNRKVSYSHCEFFRYIMKKLNDCMTVKVGSPKLIKQKRSIFRYNIDDYLINILKDKIDKGIYKYRDRDGKYTILDKTKLRDITVIIPSKKNEKVIKEVENQLTESDELIVFESGASDLETKVLSAFKRAKHDYIFLLNPNTDFFVSDYVLDVKLNYNDDEILLIQSDKVYDHITFQDLKNVSMATNIKNIGSENMKALNQPSVTGFIRQMSSTSDKRKKLLKRVEKTSAIGLKERNKMRSKKRKREKREKREFKIEYNSIDKIPKIEIKNRKPRILFVCDVKGWAWWNKSLILKDYLSDEFDIGITSVIDKEGDIFDKNFYDLYFTYGYSYVRYLNDIPIHKKISGLTAHRPISMIENQMKRVAVTHANSILLYEQLQKIHPISFYVPNGVDEKIFYLKNEIPKHRDNIVIGHVGKLSSQKGQKEFIEPAIKKSGAEYINNYSKYVTKIPHKKMIDIYNDMDVFICASKEDGTPNPALEAASCGRPIISNHIGNMPEFIENGYNGFLVEKNINTYVEKINYLRENRDHLIEMGKNARKTIEKAWTWKIQAERYRDMFKIILRI